MNIKRWAFSCLTVIAATTSLVACQPAVSSYTDKYYDPELTIPLIAKTKQEGTWQTFDMVVDYRYLADGSIEVSGTAALGRHYQDLYERLTKLDLYLFLLDDAARVLDSRKIGQALAADTDTEIDFSETMPLPAGARQLAFGYEGRVLASDPEPGSDSDWFYKLPLSRTP